MHNKFCIIDGQIVTTGSMNPTVNGAYKNNNNLIVIDSPALAENYEAEFQEMWNGTFKKGEKVKNERFKLIGEDNNITLENYFCPDDKCAQKIIDIIAKAEKSIDFMTFSFTHEKIANKMLQRKLEGVKIRGVYEARQVTKYSTFKLLDYQEAEVYKDANKQNMHHKVFIIDEKIVITGSMNPSAGGDTRNDENVLIIYSEEVAKLYMDEFEDLFAQAVEKAEANS
jgi:phosphatidylserine/phosphatidylglycerophosphate/cardiolipin synthase-like enzyme